MGLALVLLESSEEEAYILEQVQPLVEEFSYVLINNLLGGPPPLQNIQHGIDLIPRSVLPNRSDYRMRPVEYDELQRQVENLMSHDLVRESVNHYIVLALMLPKKNGSWCICINSKSINKITIKYHFPIPQLDDLFDQLHREIIFFKID